MICEGYVWGGSQYQQDGTSVSFRDGWYLLAEVDSDGGVVAAVKDRLAESVGIIC